MRVVRRAGALELRVDGSLASRYVPGHETGVMKINTGCKDGGSAELWTISDGAHFPVYSDTYGEQVVEWLLAHPKPTHLLD